jgi:hypothetical protein
MKKQYRSHWQQYTTALILITSCTTNLSTPKRLTTIEGATLDEIPIPQGQVVYIQTIDPSKVQIDQLIGTADNKGDKGLYYPSKTENTSPYFQRLTTQTVRDSYQTQHPSKPFSIINASFFEDYQSSTRLSFPIKLNGKLITTGSSPYGPIPKPADAYYQTIQLKALTWNNQTATISNYDPKTGYPLNQPTIKNGLVSYAYQDHPSYALAGDPANRYHVIGIDAKQNHLLIATSNRTTLKQAAEILRQQGVTGDIMTIDGGISTYLWTAKGDLILPQVAGGEQAAALPHYLGIRIK